MTPLKMDNELPLTEASFLILLSLAPGPKHGYAIMKDVEGLSEGRVVMSTGTLYGALKRMLAQGWIERLESQETNGRERKEYALTDFGHRLLAAEVSRLDKLVTAAKAQTGEVNP